LVIWLEEKREGRSDPAGPGLGLATTSEGQARGKFLQAGMWGLWATFFAWNLKDQRGNVIEMRKRIKL
jgi:hypothetical protein